MQLSDLSLKSEVCNFGSLKNKIDRCRPEDCHLKWDYSIFVDLFYWEWGSLVVEVESKIYTQQSKCFIADIKGLPSTTVSGFLLRQNTVL